VLDEAIGLVDAVEPAFRGDGTFTGLLLEPANTAIVGASADETDYLGSVANGENDPAGEIVAIITCKRTPRGEIDLLAVITIPLAPSSFSSLTRHPSWKCRKVR
jgi:hypothetical protein